MTSPQSGSCGPLRTIPAAPSWALALLLGGSNLGVAAASPVPPTPSMGDSGGRVSGAPWSPLQDDELEQLLAVERAEADLLLRRGRTQAALAILGEHLEEEPGDHQSRALLARARLGQGRYDDALREAGQARAEARRKGHAATLRASAMLISKVQLLRGEYTEALSTLEPAEGEARFLDAQARPSDAWVIGRVHAARGDREAAVRVFRDGSQARVRAQDWRGLLNQARCLRGMGDLVGASRKLVEADRAAQAERGAEPDILVELAGVYFESEREVAAQGQRSAGELYKAALDIHDTHEAGLLGLFELHRYNRLRQSRSPEEILATLLDAHPDSIEGRLASTATDLSDGRLRAARAGLADLALEASGRREVRALEAALAWVEHRRGDCQAELRRLAEEAPGDAKPSATVGRVLTELYRFAESVPFLQAAVEQDPSDHEAWTLLGMALANTGDEDSAREALDSATQAARGRRDAKRENLRLVLKRTAERHDRERFGELTFSWQPDAAEVLRAYLVPYYEQARTELSQRYGFTPGPTTIQVFRRHADFSVRSVGFEGFPALGVCFGPVVTALSPLSEMRGGFSWARTGFHEFSHVVHLGLSHNRCPRWITEGLATYEEVQRNPTWTRNMRRDLLDARANGDLIPVRELNRAFRGPRILFGYYQGGLLCEMLVERHGFPPMVRLLEAFDQGKDLDQAFDEVFGTTPEAVDQEFAAFVDGRLEGLALEPRWGRRTTGRLRLSLARRPPEEPTARREWAEGWTTVAWGHWQQGKPLDAEQALRRAGQAGLELPRVFFLRGEMALSAGNHSEARSLWERALDLGGADFRALMGLGALAEGEGEQEQAEDHYLAAEEAFPGYDDPDLSPERRLAAMALSDGRTDDAMHARERWLAWNPGEYNLRIEVAGWHQAADRHARAARLYEEANEVDPFRRDLHMQWGESLFALERFEEALREFQVAALVPAELDLDHSRFIGPGDMLPPGEDPERLSPGFRSRLSPEMIEPVPLTSEERESLRERAAECLEKLGRHEEAEALRAGAPPAPADPPAEDSSQGAAGRR